jgi:ketosteroid isomerase-like protein
MPSEQFVRSHFEHLEENDNESFYRQVAENATFKVTGHGNPLYGVYTSKSEYFEKFLVPIGQRLSTSIMRRVTNVIVMGDHAVVEFVSSGKTTNGVRHDVEVCFLCRYQGEEIVEVTIYTDSATVKKVFEETQ